MCKWTCQKAIGCVSLEFRKEIQGRHLEVVWVIDVIWPGDCLGSPRVAVVTLVALNEPWLCIITPSSRLGLWLLQPVEHHGGSDTASCGPDCCFFALLSILTGCVRILVNLLKRPCGEGEAVEDMEGNRGPGTQCKESMNTKNGREFYGLTTGAFHHQGSWWWGTINEGYWKENTSKKETVASDTESKSQAAASPVPGRVAGT